MHKTWRWTASGADFILPHEEIQKICLHAGMAVIANALRLRRLEL